MRLFNSILNIFRFNRRNWRAVVLCVFAATIFWFFNALNKSYTTNINFPLSFDYDRDNFVPVRNLPAQVRLNVTGNGWDPTDPTWGNAWENQALFGFDDRPLPAMNVYRR